ncbi:Nuclease-related domain protein [Solibacillus isronensis B3W22]|uniref:Nuclease-related domain protein n=1 Tax=Solibacillus isronensis B3W22 TaxID=1224748 RepID=K1L3W3_9BACL|nr:nuclease-related domain-containing protein [Solibacillus isronensis]AMO87191.1 5,10-methylenetetrahydrofolate reductase [Solibacillus silvestris]EKB45278.1 Nuclease-related domain protein [Solibacillus isronensis B3W22]
MTLFLLVVLIAIIGYFIFKLYTHDNTTFYQLTGYSYFDVLMNKSVRTSYQLVKELEHVQGIKKVMVNLQLPVHNEVQTIDALLLHESGIYVVKVKDKSGWINGREQGIEWIELLHKNKKQVFNNPIHETKRLTHVLKDQLPEVDGTFFETLVVFTNGCSFQQVEVQSSNVEVLKMAELKKWAKTLEGKRLSETEIENVYTTLEAFMHGKNTTLHSKTDTPTK